MRVYGHEFGPDAASKIPRASEEVLRSIDAKLLDERGNLRVLPAGELRSIPELRAWAFARGVYSFPTTELVGWLREQIGSFPAIEVGAGNGALGRALGIPTTDSYIQATNAGYQQFCDEIGAAPTAPATDVRRMDAEEAVRRLRPHTVVACWVTRLRLRGEGELQGFVRGVDWSAILKKVRRVIYVGNEMIHGDYFLGRLWKEYRPEWLVSRSLYADLDRIWVVQGRRF